MPSNCRPKQRTDMLLTVIQGLDDLASLDRDWSSRGAMYQNDCNLGFSVKHDMQCADHVGRVQEGCFDMISCPLPPRNTRHLQINNAVASGPAGGNVYELGHIAYCRHRFVQKPHPF